MAESSYSQTRKRSRKDTDDQEWEVEAILASRSFCGRIQYQVQWKGWDTDPTWYNGGGFEHAARLLQEFHQRHPEQPGPPKRFERLLTSANRKGLLAIATSKKQRTEKDDNSEAQSPHNSKEEKEGFHSKVKSMEEAGEDQNNQSNLQPKDPNYTLDQEECAGEQKNTAGKEKIYFDNTETPTFHQDCLGENDTDNIDIEDCESNLACGEVADACNGHLHNYNDTIEYEDENQRFDQDSNLVVPKDAAEEEKTTSNIPSPKTPEISQPDRLIGSRKTKLKENAAEANVLAYELAQAFRQVDLAEEQQNTSELTSGQSEAAPTETAPIAEHGSLQLHQTKNVLEEIYLHGKSVYHMAGSTSSDLRRESSSTHYGTEGKSTAINRLEYDENDDMIHVFIQPEQMDEYLLGDGLAHHGLDTRGWAFNVRLEDERFYLDEKNDICFREVPQKSPDHSI